MRRILLVEDSRTQALVTSKVLERNGYEVIVAENGEQGVHLAKNYSPDLVIMDVVMPGAGGYRATREIANNKATEKIPVVMMSSKNQIADKLWALRQGAMGYLVKPVNQSDLLNTVRNLLSVSEPELIMDFF